MRATPHFAAFRFLLLGSVLAISGCGRPAASPALAPVKSSPSARFPEKDAEAVLNIYSWPDYIALDTLANFERETGIKVNYQTFDNDQALEAKMLLGSSNYDVVLPSGPYFARLLKVAGYYKLDKAELPNYRNLDPAILERMATYDPGNLHAVPFMWTTTGIAYDTEKASKRIGPSKPDSWALIFDPAVAAKFADCGIALVDSPTEVFSIVLMYMGKDARQLDLANLATASELLKKIRPYIRYVSSTRHIDDLGNGSLCLALTWSGDAVVAGDKAQTAGRSGRLVFMIPKEGGLMALDMMSIPADAPHPHNAHLWLNYTMRPDVIAHISNAIKYPNGNLASIGLIHADVKANPAIYPDSATFKRLTSSIAASPEYSLIVRREWARFKTNYQ